MIPLSPSGTTTQQVTKPSNQMVVGTASGVVFLEKNESGEWRVQSISLENSFVSSVIELGNGVLAVGTHGDGVAVSEDNGRTWQFCNQGLKFQDVWVLKAAKLGGQQVLLAGTEPAHLFISKDLGQNWSELENMRNVESVQHWFFPPPPHIAHVKDIFIDYTQGGESLYVSIEVGALLRSDDGGTSWREHPVEADPRKIDAHRLIIHPDRPERLLLATGWGLYVSDNKGATWAKQSDLPGIGYPDPFVTHPTNPNLLFVAGGDSQPHNWLETGRSNARIARSRDGGKNWEHLCSGLPEGQRASYGAMSLEAYPDGYTVYAGNTDGEIFCTTDGGDNWGKIATVAPISKGLHYKILAAEGNREAPTTNDLKLPFPFPNKD
ncbi:exo-alpha-sialidase [Scytonema tolypothrichoides VB-61278]|nr:exo-alpha-sialidase [Scytonema tolypothrichoides VB-61278]